MVKKIKYVSVMIVLFFIGFNMFTINIVSAAAKKEYTERYNALEQKCQKKFKYDGSQSEMNAESYAEYKLWNKELKYVYTSILKTLNESKAEELEASEIKWKKRRKKKATEDAAVYAGGSMQLLEFNRSMSAQTKKRIKWLIKNYS